MQLEWLAKALDARSAKPAIVLAHHNPDPIIRIHGLTDTAELFQVLAPRKQVKAYVFGHTHQWRLDRLFDIHLVNVPAIAWPFEPSQVRGYVSARLRRDGMTLALHALDHNHAKHGEKVELQWRT